MIHSIYIYNNFTEYLCITVVHICNRFSSYRGIDTIVIKRTFKKIFNVLILFSLFMCGSNEIAFSMNRDDELGQHPRFGENRWGVTEEDSYSSNEEIHVITSQPQQSDEVYRRFLEDQGIEVVGENEEMVASNETEDRNHSCSIFLRKEPCYMAVCGGGAGSILGGLGQVFLHAVRHNVNSLTNSLLSLSTGTSTVSPTATSTLGVSTLNSTTTTNVGVSILQEFGLGCPGGAIGCALGCCIGYAVGQCLWGDNPAVSRTQLNGIHERMYTILRQRSGGPVDMDTRISQQRPLVRRHMPRTGQHVSEEIELQNFGGGGDPEVPIVHQPSPINLASRPLPPLPPSLASYRESFRNTDPNDDPDESSDHHHRRRRRHQEQGRHTPPLGAVSRSDDSTTSAGSSDPIYAIVHRNNLILSGYTREGHIRSLLSMQNVLLGSSERIRSILRSLVLQAQEGSAYPQDFFRSIPNTVGAYRHIHGPSKKGTAPIPLRKTYAILPYKTFGFIGGYERDLEYKTRSSQRGILIECCPGIRVGFLYMYHNGAPKVFTCDAVSSNVGSVKTKLKVEGVSTVVFINPDNTGITGRFASCYNWGMAKNTRQFMHSGQEQRAKGSPSVYMTGGLGQLGYTLRLSNKVSFIPYIESTFSIAQCSRYKEHSSLLPCLVSKNRERTWERSIGLQSQWNMTNAVQIRTWVSSILGYHTLRHLTSSPLIVSTPSVQYKAWVPMRNKQYKTIEVGVVLHAALSHTFDMGCTVTTRFYGVKKSLQQQIGSYIRYTY